jgi:hypothetical protein
VLGAKVKQPFAITMGRPVPFEIAGVWENWKAAAASHIRAEAGAVRMSALELISKPESARSGLKI